MLFINIYSFLDYIMLELRECLSISIKSIVCLTFPNFSENYQIPESYFGSS